MTACSDEGVIEVVSTEDYMMRQERVLSGSGCLWIMLVVWLFFSYLDADQIFHKDRGYIVMFVKFILFFVAPIAVLFYVFREISLM